MERLSNQLNDINISDIKDENLQQIDRMDDNVKIETTESEEDSKRRFVDTPTHNIYLSPNRTFYTGDFLQKRMDEIRKSIEYIRSNWNAKYNQLLKDLRDFIIDSDCSSIDRDLQCALAKRYSWDDTSSEIKLLQCYTKDQVYRQVFERINNSIFRNDEATIDEKRIRVAVFLIELMNIELYNLCLIVPSKANFEGVVYRGIGLEVGCLQEHLDIMKKPIVDRYLAIPLSLQSTSKSLKVALDFMRSKSHLKKRKEELERNKSKEDLERQIDIENSDRQQSNEGLERQNDRENSDRQTQLENKSSTFAPVLFKTHVISLREDLLKEYKKRFPISVVSSICAMDISEQGYYKDEQEVLLRGPFFQLLKSSIASDNGETYTEIEQVIISANRDHSSTSLLGDQSSLARSIFGTMVKVTRYEFAEQFCKNNDLFNDAEEYARVLIETRSKLNDLLAENIPVQQ